MDPKWARVLVGLYPRAWRARYGAEFEALLTEGKGGVRTVVDVVWAAAVERVAPTAGGEMGLAWAEGWGRRAPWVVFGLAPVVALGATYFVACFILWSGWQMFLPGELMPFVRLDRVEPSRQWVAMAYFGVGRLLYFCAPVLVGWGMAIVAARWRAGMVWPLVGMVVLAVAGGMAQVHAARPSLEAAGQVGMGLGAMNPGYSGVVLVVTMLPYVLRQLGARRM